MYANGLRVSPIYITCRSLLLSLRDWGEDWANRRCLCLTAGRSHLTQPAAWSDSHVKRSCGERERTTWGHAWKKHLRLGTTLCNRGHAGAWRLPDPAVRNASVSSDPSVYPLMHQRVVSHSSSDWAMMSREVITNQKSRVRSDFVFYRTLMLLFITSDSSPCSRPMVLIGWLSKYCFRLLW